MNYVIDGDMYYIEDFEQEKELLRLMYLVEFARVQVLIQEMEQMWLMKPEGISLAAARWENRMAEIGAARKHAESNMRAFKARAGWTPEELKEIEEEYYQPTKAEENEA